MNHNRPFYGKKVCVILPSSGLDLLLYRNIGKWFEQISANVQVHIIDDSAKNNIYLLVREICHRYKLSFDTTLQSRCVIWKNKSIREAVDSCECDIVTFALPNHLPRPYCFEIALNTLSENEYVTQRGMIICSKKQLEGLPLDNVGQELSTKYKPHKLLDDIVDFIYEQETRLPKCTVFIPVMNREENIKQTLFQWLMQLYQNKQIVVIDYGSDEHLMPVIENICIEHKVKFSYNEYDDDADVMLFRIDGVKHFNISHAYNSIIKRVKTDIVCTVCADSCPRDYYLTMVANAVDEKSLVQTWWGLHAITYDNWERLNGHQEFIVGWGGEDDDFRMRAILMGLSVKILPNTLVYQIEQNVSEKGKCREVSDVLISAQINMGRFTEYIGKFGYVGNYGQPIGNEKPIRYFGIDQKVQQIACCTYKQTPENMPQNISFNPEYNAYYIVLSQETLAWTQWTEWAKYGATRHNGVYVLIDEKDIQQVLSRFQRDTLSVPA